MYAIIKTLHILTAALTVTLLTARTLASLHRPYGTLPVALRVAPHVNDTALLATAIWLAWAGHHLPWQQSWLAAKIVAVVAYIGLGGWTLKRAPTPLARLAGLAGCWLLAAYIVGAVRHHSAWSWLERLG